MYSKSVVCFYTSFLIVVFIYSELQVGVVDIDPSEVVQKDRLRPGRILLVDTVKQSIILDQAIKEEIADLRFGH